MCRAGRLHAPSRRPGGSIPPLPDRLPLVNSNLPHLSQLHLDKRRDSWVLHKQVTGVLLKHTARERDSLLSISVCVAVGRWSVLDEAARECSCSSSGAASYPGWLSPACALIRKALVMHSVGCSTGGLAWPGRKCAQQCTPAGALAIDCHFRPALLSKLAVAGALCASA